MCESERESARARARASSPQEFGRKKRRSSVLHIQAGRTSFSFYLLFYFSCNKPWASLRIVCVCLRRVGERAFKPRIQCTVGKSFLQFGWGGKGDGFVCSTFACTNAGNLIRALNMRMCAIYFLFTYGFCFVLFLLSRLQDDLDKAQLERKYFKVAL